MSISKNIKLRRFNPLIHHRKHGCKFVQFFGKEKLIHAHQLENQLISLDLIKFPQIEDYITTLKPLILQLSDCEISKLDD
jgi:hypothetical protein